MRKGSHLYKRQGVYYARFQVNGQEIRRSLRTSNRDEARRRLNDLAKQVEKSTALGSRRMSWEQAAGYFLAEIGPRTVSSNTLSRYTSSIRALAGYFEGRWIDEIEISDIAAYVDWRRKTGQRRHGGKQVSNATIRRDINTLSRVLASVMQLGAVSRNAAADYDKTFLPEVRPPASLPSDKDVSELIRQLENPHGDIVEFLAETGARQGEAISLTWDRVRPGRTLQDWTATIIGKGRNGQRKARTITLRPAAASVLKRRMEARESDSLVFPDPRTGEQFAHYRSDFRDVARPLGFGYRCHDLRHRFAVRRLQEGWSIYRVSRYLGHTSVKTTEQYYLRYLTEEEVRRAFGDAETGTEVGTAPEGV